MCLGGRSGQSNYHQLLSYEVSVIIYRKHINPVAEDQGRRISPEVPLRIPAVHDSEKEKPRASLEVDELTRYFTGMGMRRTPDEEGASDILILRMNPPQG